MKKHSHSRRYLHFSSDREVWKAIGPLLAVYTALMVVAARPLRDWAFSQWMFSYEIKFVKRGLHGEIVRLLGIDISYLLITFIALLILLALHLLLLPLFSRPFRIESSGPSGIRRQFSISHWKNRPLHIGLFLFFLMTLFHSVSFQRMIQFIGYLEYLQLIIVLGCLYTIRKLSLHISNKAVPFKSSLILFSVVCLISVTCLLIHEGFLLFYMPLIFGYWTYSVPGSGKYNILRILLFVILVAITWIISTYGLLSPDQFQTFLDARISKFGSHVDYSSIRVLSRDFNENITFTRNWIVSSFTIRVIHFVFFIIIISPTVYVFWKIYQPDFKKLRLILFSERRSTDKTDSTISKTSTQSRDAFFRILLVFCALSPLLMTPFGIDFYRWVAIAIMNLFIATALLLYRQHFREQTAEILYKQRYMVIVVIALSLIFGALRITNSFPWVYDMTTNLGLGY